MFAGAAPFLFTQMTNFAADVDSPLTFLTSLPDPILCTLLPFCGIRAASSLSRVSKSLNRSLSGNAAALRSLLFDTEVLDASSYSRASPAALSTLSAATLASETRAAETKIKELQSYMQRLRFSRASRSATLLFVRSCEGRLEISEEGQVVTRIDPHGGYLELEEMQQDMEDIYPIRMATLGGAMVQGPQQIEFEIMKPNAEIYLGVLRADFDVENAFVNARDDDLYDVYSCIVTNNSSTHPLLNALVPGQRVGILLDFDERTLRFSVDGAPAGVLHGIPHGPLLWGVGMFSPGDRLRIIR